MQPYARLAATISLALAAVVGFPSAAGAAGAELFTGNAGHLEVRPPIIELSGDGTATVGGPNWRAPDAFALAPGASGRPTSYGAIQWSQFGDVTALGRGVFWLDNGIPDDSSGTFYRYPASIEASKPQAGRYMSLAVRFTVDGVHVVDSYTLNEGEGQPSFWGGPGQGVTINYCMPPPVFYAGEVVESVVGTSCGAVDGVLRHHRIVPLSSLFRPGHHTEHIAGFRCTSWNFIPKSKRPDLPSFVTKGSGDAQCTAGQHGFFFTYAE